MLSRNNLHSGWRIARRTFTAKCGHTIHKGEHYLAMTDYFNGERIYISNCAACTKLKPLEATA